MIKRAFDMTDGYFTKNADTAPCCRQMTEMFGHENVVRVWDLPQMKEPLVCMHASLSAPFRTAVDQIEKLKILAEYEYPIVAFSREEGLRIAGTVLAEMPRCFDAMFSFNPFLKPFPSHRWFKLYPDTTNLGIPYASRKYDLCFVGRPASRKSPNLVAAMLSEHPNAVVAMTVRGVSGMPIYRACAEWAIEKFLDPSRKIINEIFNDSRFLIYPSNFGPAQYDTLENSVLEAVVAKCAPILNRVWCSRWFEGYPAQVATRRDCERLVLDEDLYYRCLQFLDNQFVITHDCRTVRELLGILNAREYHVDPERPRRCREVIEHIKAGQHLIRGRFDRGPFYRYDLPKTMDYKETFNV